MQVLKILNLVKSSTKWFQQYTGVPKKVSIKNFNSDLFITLIHSILTSLESVDL